MSLNRRDFIKKSGLAALGVAAATTACVRPENAREKFSEQRTQRFNMHGYAAPAIETVRVGFIGVGNRGSGAVARVNALEGVEIKAICDLEESAIDRTLNRLRQRGGELPQVEKYHGSEDVWKELCDRDDIDLVIISTPWHLHAPQCVYAMNSGKHVATEIPAARTIDECWQLVEASERNRKHCFQMTNVCYSFFEMVTLNMARSGFLGEIVHGDGAYIHQLIGSNFNKNGYHNMWRLRENYSRNGNLYPHHGLGTIAQIMDINHGDRLDYMVSVSSNDFMMQKRAAELAEEDSFFKEFTGKSYRGNMNTSIIRTEMGRTIMLQHDVTSPRPYSRIHQISGTKAIARAYPVRQIANSYGGWFSDAQFAKIEQEYTPEITRRAGEMARQVGGHGGMDSLLMWRLIDCLRNGIPLDMNVYDAATWSAVIPISEHSVANEGIPIDFPDFTAGAWRSNKPGMDIQLEKGGTTKFAIRS